MRRSNALLAPPLCVLMLLAAYGGAMGQARAADGAPSHKAGVAAVVNDEIITLLEVDDRLDLIRATTDLPDTDETRTRLTPQVMRMLIDEKLQMQEAKRLNIGVPESDVKDAIAGIESQAGRPAGSLEADIKARGASVASLYAQLRAQGAWSQIILQKVRPRIRVSNEEAERESARVSVNGGAGGQELQLTVLSLPVENGGQEPRVKALAAQLAGEVKKGTSLAALSRQLASNGAPPATEGVWVKPSDVDPALGAALKNAKQGQVVGPVRTRAGYQLVQIVGTRQSGGGDAAGGGEEPPVEILLKQILFALKEDASKPEVDATLVSAREVRKNPGTCGDTKVAGVDNAEDMHMEVSFLRTLLSRLPKAVQPLVKDLGVGTVSEPFATPDGIQLLVLCERIEMPRAAPDVDEEVKNRIFREKLEREAMKYLRDLRRTALTDIRTP